MSNESVHVIACGVLAIDLNEVARRLGVSATMEYLPGGLHDSPQELKRRLQAAVDEASGSRRASRIALGYGVCGLGSVGICARNVPLAIPRVNDCIALFLGSDAAYREQFARYPGTYYIAAGWVEEKAQPQSAGGERIQCGPTCFTFEQLAAQYGEENAAAIREFLSSWQRNYQRAAFIDTGAAGKSRRYAELAKAMAREFGWKYEQLRGSGDLLAKLLTAQHSTDEVLLVSPHHVTAFDAATKRLIAVPVWEAGDSSAQRDYTLTFDEPEAAAAQDRPARIGLGIDAGGTYTDVVLYDFQRDEVLQKSKALTTKWDFTVGIQAALDQLDPQRLTQVDLVAISTTLATNAIVEGRGQKVGLLIMPPYGIFAPDDIAYRPLEVIDGRLEIDGHEIDPVDPQQVRRVARQMVDRHDVGAFAVTGYASHVNPSHELQVKAIVQETTGLHVTCGHDVSAQLNYRVRAVTAALNASIIPCLESFLDDVQAAMGRRGIDSPKMVVKSDGSLMSLPVARRRPIETILSGPAASVAGAGYLARLPEAMVVDMGGTTTDTAVISAGVGRASEESAVVGGWRTHVRALDLRTLGLGGDSLIAHEKGELRIGPLRVAPVAWIFSRGGRAATALDWLEANLDRFRGSTRPMEMLAANGRADSAGLTDDERRVLDAVADGPMSLHELARRLDAPRWNFLPVDRLERRHLIQRCGLTPTDVLHAAGLLQLWNAEAAGRMCDLFCRLLGVSQQEFAETVHRRIVHRLATELVKKQLADRIDVDELDRSPAAETLLENWRNGGANGCRVRIALEHPVIGIGAPVHLFLPEAAKLLETEAVIPPHADVANAIGAITSSVLIRKRVEIAPSDDGRYVLAGLPDAPSFADFHKAHAFALETLQQTVRRAARESGTSQSRVEIAVHDRVAPTGFGGNVFIGRILTARLSGRPDLASESVAEKGTGAYIGETDENRHIQ